MKTSERMNQMIVRPRAAEMVPQEESQFQLIESDEAMHNVVQLIDMNLAHQKVSVFQFQQIKAPAGGSGVLRIDSTDGKQPVSELSGIIVAYRQARAYWRKAYGSGGGKKPPDCSSTNGFTGIGDPGGECELCPFNQFGTAINPDGSQADGKACKELRQLLVLLPGQLLPHMFSLPPTSVKNFMNYVWSLTSEGLEYWSVVTRFAPEGARSGGGVDFERVSFRKERRLDPEKAKRLRDYSQRMRAFLHPMTVDVSAYEVEREPEAVPQPVNDDDAPF